MLKIDCLLLFVYIDLARLPKITLTRARNVPMLKERHYLSAFRRTFELSHLSDASS